jgi:hypothetical protein
MINSTLPPILFPLLYLIYPTPLSIMLSYSIYTPSHSPWHFFTSPSTLLFFNPSYSSLHFSFLLFLHHTQANLFLNPHHCTVYLSLLPFLLSSPLHPPLHSSLRSSFLSSSLHPSLFTSLLYFLPYLVVLSCLMKHIAAVAQMPFCCCLSL